MRFGVVLMPQKDRPHAQAPGSGTLQAKFIQATAVHRQGKLTEAERIYRDILHQQPNHFDALHRLGIIAAQTDRTEMAVELIGRAIELNSTDANAHNNLGNALLELKRADDALKSYDKAIALNPGDAEAHHSRGLALQDLRRLDDALASFDQAIALKADFADAFYNRGNVLQNLNRAGDALSSYDKAVGLRPNFAEAYCNRGHTLHQLKRCDDALSNYNRAVALKPDFAEAYYNRGNLCAELKQYEEASDAYSKTLDVKPDFADAWLGLGNVLCNLKRHEEALSAYDNALDLKLDLEGAWLGRGNVLDALKRHDEAANAYARVLKINPKHPLTKGTFLHQKMLACEWTGIDDLIADIECDVQNGRLSAEPFGWQGVSKSPRSLQLCAEHFSQARFPADIRFNHTVAPLAKGRIRVGYVSGEFRDQATSHLVVGVLEQHDKSRFEIFAFDNGWDDHSEIRKRINDAVSNVIDVSRLSDSATAATIHESQIDILVNLNGYFGEHRMGVFAQRPAPIQVNYLGFPGTLGANYIDYIVADRHVIPEDQRKFYAEKIVYLPNGYQPNDREKSIASYTDRAEYGLPERGFVFCCFNNNYKILPAVFDGWMRILGQVSDSVLWLIAGGATTETNLRKEAMARGVSAERLVFAKRIPLPLHLGRHQRADLFIDTLPYNAHTTASDALWAGLPVLTCVGETFAGRVGASLLNAIHLPELITATLEEYENVAIDLATHPKKLDEIRNKLAKNRLTTPLFDTALYTKHIELAYLAMYERRQGGLPAHHIVVQSQLR
jgi:protein O-GlcNAc transferase